jgi:glutaredoxin-like YruB-family protein
MEQIIISSHDELIHSIKEQEKAYVLLYKSGSEQSECALNNIRESRKDDKSMKLYLADVSKVRDIHIHYNVKTAPSLLEFEKGIFKNIVKGCNNPGFYTSIFENIYLNTTTEGEKAQPRVSVYSTPTCSWCNTLKAYLRKNKIRFRDIDVSKDQNAAEAMVRKSGQQGVPQTDINGQIIVGFDKTRINNLLGIQG